MEEELRFTNWDKGFHSSICDFGRGMSSSDYHTIFQTIQVDTPLIPKAYQQPKLILFFLKKEFTFRTACIELSISSKPGIYPGITL